MRFIVSIFAIVVHLVLLYWAFPPVVAVAGSGDAGTAFAARVAQAPAVQAARLRVEAARARLGSSGKFPESPGGRHGLAG